MSILNDNGGYAVDRKQVVLPYCSAMLEPDIVPLQHRYRSGQDRASLVSILNENSEYAVDKKTSCLTVLL